LAARSGRPIAAAVRELVGLADLAVLSGRKDAGGARLGLVVVGAGGRVPLAALHGASDMLFGTCPYDPAQQAGLARGLARLPDRAAARWAALEGLGRALRAAGLSLVGVGGGSIFLDAAALLPALPRDALAAPTLLALLYAAAGLRG